MKMSVPFLDLVAPHKELEEELVEVFRGCLRTASFVGGAQVQSFEEEFAAFCETKYCIAVNSGTDALRFALIASGIGPGDEVITVPNTFIATTEAISQAGATPAFVDIDERTYNMDPSKLEEYLRTRKSEAASGKGSDSARGESASREGSPLSPFLSPTAYRLPPDTSFHSPNANRIRAILPVHLYGQPADMDAILEIANRYGLIVIEDACQAHGAAYYSQKEKRWRKAGSMGLAAGFSFYPGKNLGACGEGGAVTTSDGAVAQKIRMLRDHGQAKKYYHDFEGYNGRLDSMQTGILRVKLKHLSDWNEKRRRIASRYNQLFIRSETQGVRGEGTQHLSLDTVISPFEPSWARAVYHLYIVRVQERERLQAHLSENGVATGLHYPVPVHLQKAYGGRGFKEGDFPVTERVAKEILSLPMFPQLAAEQQEYVASHIKKFVSGQSKA